MSDRMTCAVCGKEYSSETVAALRDDQVSALQSRNARLEAALRKIEGRDSQINATANGDREVLRGEFATIARAALSDEIPDTPPAPIDMILYCPSCGYQHIDKPDGEWTNPPHRSHLCHSCGYIWRPADVPTNGVESIRTRGKADNFHGIGQVATAAHEIDETLASLTASESKVAALEAERDRLREALELCQPCVMGYIDRCNYTEGHNVLRQLQAALSTAPEPTRVGPKVKPHDQCFSPETCDCECSTCTEARAGLADTKEGE